MVAIARSTSGPGRMRNDPTRSGAKPWASETAELSGTASSARDYNTPFVAGLPAPRRPVRSSSSPPACTWLTGSPVRTTITPVSSEFTLSEEAERGPVGLQHGALRHRADDHHAFHEDAKPGDLSRQLPIALSTQ